LVYYPEGNPTTVDPQNSSFSTSFEYQILDNDTTPLPSNATLFINATIPIPTITADYDVDVYFDYTIDEPLPDAAKVIIKAELEVAYTNDNNVSPVSIKILTLPSDGELGIFNGTTYIPVSVNQVITNTVIDNNHFVYFPEKVDGTGTPSGDFTTTFTYLITDPQGNNTTTFVTMTIHCHENIEANRFIKLNTRHIS
jgi:hypothetical protein